MAGNEDLHGHAAQQRAPMPGYFAGALARAALVAQVEFAIGACRIGPAVADPRLR